MKTPSDHIDSNHTLEETIQAPSHLGKLHILILEDFQEDVELMKRELKNAGLNFKYKQVTNEEEFSEALFDFEPDLVLSDFNLPSFDGLSALQITQTKRPQLPFILVSGILGEEQAIEALKSGATDYVLKQRLSRLPQAVSRALKEAQERRERKYAEMALMKSEYRYRTIVQNSPICIYEMDTNGKVISMNKTGLAILGLTSEQDIIGRDFLSIVSAQDTQRAETIMKETLAGKLCKFEFTLESTKQESIILHSSLVPVRHPLGNLEKIVAFLEDVTERKIAEQKLKESKERIELTIKGADLVSWDWNLSTGKVILNERWSEMTGYSTDEIVEDYNKLRKLIHPEDRTEAESAMQDHLSTRTSLYQSEHRVKVKDGTWKWIYERGKVLAFDSSGKPLRVYGTILDITERKHNEIARMEGQLMERKRIAREIHDSIGQMLIAIKYDVSNLAETIGKKYFDRFETLEGLLQATIGEARRISKNLSSSDFDIEGFKIAMQSLIEQTSQLTHLVINYSIDVNVKTVENEKLHSLFRIVQEAINNVVKHAEASEVKIDLYQDKNNMILAISDDGKGLDPVLLTSTKRANGNGLRNMRERARISGGKFEISPGTESGTKVKITIPV
ncbi:MAG: PAS domain S-box protein [Bacteroidota bacterium]